MAESRRRWGRIQPDAHSWTRTPRAGGGAIDARGDLFTADCHTLPITLVLPGACYESFGRPHDGVGFGPTIMNNLADKNGWDATRIACPRGGTFKLSSFSTAST